MDLRHARRPPAAVRHRSHRWVRLHRGQELRKGHGLVRCILPVLAVVCGSLAACHSSVLTTPPLVSIGPDRTVSAQVGGAIDITLQTVGPGYYVTPPTVSSPAVRFLSENEPDGFANPAGPTQVFHFRAVAPGQAVVGFTHTGGFPGQTYPSTSDTIVVQ